MNPIYAISDKKITRNVSLISGLLFWIFSFTYLAVSYRYLLEMTENLSLFVYDVPFFLSKVSQPGGILLYISCFFTQFTYYPWLGAIIITAFLQLIQWLTHKSFMFTRKYFIFSYIPSFVLLIIITDAGRSLYLMSHVEYIFTNLLGIFALLLAYYCYTRIEIKKNRATYLCCVLPFIFFCISGSCAIYFCVLVFLSGFMGLKRKHELVVSLLVLALYFALFFVAAYFVYPYSAHYQVLFGIHPIFSSSQSLENLTPHLILPVYFLLILIIQRFFPWGDKIYSYPRWTYINLIGLFLLCIITASAANGYDDFRYEMVIDRSIQDKNFDRALRVGKDAPHPTREMTVLRNFALAQSGKMGEGLFEYTQNFASDGLFLDYVNDKPVHPVGSSIYFYLGAQQLAFRWSVKNYLEKESSFRMVSNFLPIAIVDKNWVNVAKIGKKLQNTLFHKDLGQEAEDISTRHTLTDKYKDLEDIEKRVSTKLYVFPKQGDYSIFLDHFYHENPHNPVAFDYYMASLLLDKKLVCFVSEVSAYTLFYQKALPKHYREALLLNNYLHPDSTFSIKDRDLEEKFTDFLKLKSEQHSKQAERNYMRRAFGNTYWWYYMYK